MSAIVWASRECAIPTDFDGRALYWAVPLVTRESIGGQMNYVIRATIEDIDMAKKKGGRKC